MSQRPAAKRARVSEQLAQHGMRKLLLSLESGIPEEISWALGSMLIASCPPETAQPQPDKLDKAISLQSSPGLLGVLLPLALAPSEREDQALYPTPVAHTNSVALREAHRRQVRPQRDSPYSMALGE